MQSFTVTGRGWSGGILAILGGGSVIALAVGAVFEPVLLIPTAGWVVLVWNFTWNAVRSLISGEVILGWDGQRLVVRPSRGEPLIQIETAQWVYTDGSNIVVRASQPMPRFNSGHVRCNGRELVVESFLGSVPQGLRSLVQGIGPTKQWLWRYLPI